MAVTFREYETWSALLSQLLQQNPKVILAIVQHTFQAVSINNGVTPKIDPFPFSETFRDGWGYLHDGQPQAIPSPQFSTSRTATVFMEPKSQLVVPWQSLDHSISRGST